MKKILKNIFRVTNGRTRDLIKNMAFFPSYMKCPRNGLSIERWKVNEQENC